MSGDLRDFPTSLTRDNRAKGLMRELMEVIDSEESSLTLSRLAAALRLASQQARGKSADIELTTKEIERAMNARPRRDPMIERLKRTVATPKRRWLA